MIKRRSNELGMCLWGHNVPPILSELQENWSNVGHAAREMVTAFSVTFSVLITVFVQMVSSPKKKQYEEHHLSACEK